MNFDGYDYDEFFYNIKNEYVFYEELDTEFINGKSLKFDEFGDLITILKAVILLVFHLLLVI